MYKSSAYYNFSLTLCIGYIFLYIKIHSASILLGWLLFYKYMHENSVIFALHEEYCSLQPTASRTQLSYGIIQPKYRAVIWPSRGIWDLIVPLYASDFILRRTEVCSVGFYSNPSERNLGMLCSKTYAELFSPTSIPSKEEYIFNMVQYGDMYDAIS